MPKKMAGHRELQRVAAGIPQRASEEKSTMSIETIHHNITYNTEGFDEDCMGLSVLWDDKDETLDDLMNNEHHPKIGKIINLWIEKIKEMSDWKLGEKLYIFTKSNSDYNFNCWFSKNNDEFGYFDFIVEKNGYVVSVRYFNNYYRGGMRESGAIYQITVPDNTMFLGAEVNEHNRAQNPND